MAPLPIRSDRAAELRRICGHDVEIIETSRTEPSFVAAIVASFGADVVLLDVVEPMALGALVDELRSYTLLRPLVEYVRTSRAEQRPVFVGYGRISATGSVEPLADGALSPPA